MLLKRSPDVRASDITPESLYLRRREFMRVAGTALVAATGSLVAGCNADVSMGVLEGSGLGVEQTPLAGIKPKVVTTDETLNTFEEITSYNNFYEFGHGKDDPAAVCGASQDQPVEGQDRRAVRQAGGIPARGPDQAVRARGAHLPAPLRRGVVDGDSVGRHSAQQHSQARRAASEGDVRRVHDAAAAVRDAGSEGILAQLAVHRRSADGRSDAPADDPGRRVSMARR